MITPEAELLAHLERRVFIRAEFLTCDRRTAVALFITAGMQPVTRDTWAPGPNTLAWVIAEKFPALAEALC